MALKSSGQRCLQAVLQAGRGSVRCICGHPSERKFLSQACCGLVLRLQYSNRSSNRYSICHESSSLVNRAQRKALRYSTQAATQGSSDSYAVLYSLTNIKVKGSDEAVLDSYTQFVTRASKILKLDMSGRIVLPTHIERHTLLKSPHIYKKHRAQYEVRTHGRLLQLRNVTGETADVFLEYVQRNLPEGVSMSVEQTSMEAMPDYLRPPPEALAFLQTRETPTA